MQTLQLDIAHKGELQVSNKLKYKYKTSSMNGCVMKRTYWLYSTGFLHEWTYTA